MATYETFDDAFIRFKEIRRRVIGVGVATPTRNRNSIIHHPSCHATAPNIPNPTSNISSTPRHIHSIVGLMKLAIR